MGWNGIPYQNTDRGGSGGGYSGIPYQNRATGERGGWNGIPGGGGRNSGDIGDRIVGGLESFVGDIFNNPRRATRQLEDWNRFGAGVTNTVDGTQYRRFDAEYGRQSYRARDGELQARQTYEARELGMDPRQYRQQLQQQQGEFDPRNRGSVQPQDFGGQYGYQQQPGYASQYGYYAQQQPQFDPRRTAGGPPPSGVQWYQNGQPVQQPGQQTPFVPSQPQQTLTPPPPPPPPPSTQQQATPPVTGQQPVTQPVTGQQATPPATDPQPTTTTPPTTAPVELPAGTEPARLHGMRRQAAPAANEIPRIGENQVQTLQTMLLAAGMLDATPGADGKFGPMTNGAIDRFAQSIGIADHTTLDFTQNPPQGDTLRFLQELDGRNPARAPQQQTTPAPATTQTVEQPAPAQPQPQPQQVAPRDTHINIVVDLPNGMRESASLRNLVGLSTMRASDGERIEFNGPSGANQNILNEYVDFVRDTMAARGLDPSRGDAQATAALILAAHNNMSVDDPVRDLQRVRLPDRDDVRAAVASMSTNVLLDRDISRQELRLAAPMVQRVVFGEQPQIPPQALAGLQGVTGGTDVPGGPPGGPSSGAAVQTDPSRGRQ